VGAAGAEGSDSAAAGASTAVSGAGAQLPHPSMMPPNAQLLHAMAMHHVRHGRRAEAEQALAAIEVVEGAHVWVQVHACVPACVNVAVCVWVGVCV